jgi:hypothetical protein
MVPGDLLAHDFPTTYASVTHNDDREHYRAFVLKTLGFLALEFRKRFGDTKILVTPGNNDEECGDNSIEAHGRFLNDTADSPARRWRPTVGSRRNGRQWASTVYRTR